MFFHIRLAALVFLGLPLIAGAAITPQGASAFVMGAWAGVILAGPPLVLLALVLGVYSLPQALAPLLRLPVLFVLSFVALSVSGVELGLGVQAFAAAAMLWWLRKGRLLLGL